MPKFCEKNCKLFANNLSKEICTFLVFLDFWTNVFCKHFYYITGFCDKKFNFCKFANFFADSKRRAQELSNDVSFVIFGHQTWDLEVGVKFTPLPSISWFSSTPAEIGLNCYFVKSCYLVNSEKYISKQKN